MKSFLWLFVAALSFAVTLQSPSAEAWSWGRKHRDRNDENYSSPSSPYDNHRDSYRDDHRDNDDYESRRRACRDAIDNAAYTTDQANSYGSLVNGNSCGDNVACKFAQAQALQYSIQQAQKAESARARNCN